MPALQDREYAIALVQISFVERNPLHGAYLAYHMFEYKHVLAPLKHGFMSHVLILCVACFVRSVLLSLELV